MNWCRTAKKIKKATRKWRRTFIRQWKVHTHTHSQNIRTKRGNEDKMWKERERKNEKKKQILWSICCCEPSYATIMCINFTTDTFYALLVYDNSRARSLSLRFQIKETGKSKTVQKWRNWMHSPFQIDVDFIKNSRRKERIFLLIRVCVLECAFDT